MEIFNNLVMILDVVYPVDRVAVIVEAMQKTKDCHGLFGEVFLANSGSVPCRGYPFKSTSATHQVIDFKTTLLDDGTAKISMVVNPISSNLKDLIRQGYKPAAVISGEIYTSFEPLSMRTGEQLSAREPLCLVYGVEIVLSQP